MRLRRYAGILVTAALLALAAACGGGSDGGSSGGGSGGGEAGTFVTPSADAPIYAAMLANDSTRLVFVTDAQMLHSTFRGDNTGDEAPFTLTNEDGDSIELTRAGEGYTGTFTSSSGDTFDVTMEPPDRRNAGLYRNREHIRGEDWIIGLIVLNDGKVVGASRNSVTGVVERRTTLSIGLKWEDPTADP